MNHFPVNAAPSGSDYMFVLVMVNLSGNMALIGGARQEPILLLFLTLLALRFIILRQKVTENFLSVTYAFILLLLLQAVFLPFFNIITSAGFLVKILIAALTIISVQAFRIAFVRVMVWITMTSLIFHVPNILGYLSEFQIYELFRPIARIVNAHQPHEDIERINILVHNFMTAELSIRNSSVFWEPGAFSGYLILAIILLATIQNDLPRKWINRWCVILVIGVLSTLSTTGYLSLPFALFAFRIIALDKEGISSRSTISIIAFFTFLIPLSLYSWQFDFIGNKILELYERAIYQDAGWQLSRFGALLFDWEYIQERPLFGWSQSNELQYSLHPDLDSYATGNGLTGFIRQYGIAGLSIFIIAAWAGLALSPLSSIWIISLIIIQLNGEFFLNYPLYLCLAFLGSEKGFRHHQAEILTPRENTTTLVRDTRQGATS